MPTLQEVMEYVDLLRDKSVIAVEDHCVAVRNRNASCRRCINACPDNAISIDSNKITINAGACHACGACIAACPTAAIVGLRPSDDEMVKEIGDALEHTGGMVVIACARMAARNIAERDLYVSVPCLGRLDEALLIGLVTRGIDDIVLVDGVCKTCKYGKVSTCVNDVIESAIGMLEMYDTNAVITQTSEFPPELVASDSRKVEAEARRNFFTETGGYAKNVAINAGQKIVTDLLRRYGQTEDNSLRTRLSAGKTGRMPVFEVERNMCILDDLSKLGDPVDDELCSRLFASIEIDSERCNGCGMCVMFCPTAALCFSEVETPENEEMRYMEFQMADCAQCNLCADACLSHCLTMSPIISMKELFDFEPRLIEIPKQKKLSNMFNIK